MPTNERTRTSLPMVEPVLAFHAASAGIFLPFLDEPPPTEMRGRVAIVRVEGGLAQRADWFGDGYDAVEARLESALRNPDVDGVVLVLNSPGGAAAGCFEAARRMREAVAASGKPCVAYADEMAASAAYALACIGDEIWLPPSGLVGSVGVIAGLIDETAMNKELGLKVVILTTGARKADGHPDVPISDAAVAQLQARIDHLGGLFADWVAERRPALGVRAKVLALEAGCFSGGDAIAAGLADRVGSLEQAISAVASRAKSLTSTTGAARPRGALARPAANASLLTSSAREPMSTRQVSLAASAEPTKADVTFAQDMIPHHEMALTMSKALKRDGKDPTLLAMAEDILSSQTKQIEQLRAWLRDHGLDEKKSDDGGHMSRAAARSSYSFPAARAATTTGASMTPMILAALGLPEGTPPEQAGAALAPHLDRILKATGEASLAGAVGKVLAFKSSHEQAEKLTKDLAEQRETQRKADVAAQVDAKIKSGRLFESERAFAVQLGAESPESFGTFMAARTQQVVDTREITPARVETKAETDEKRDGQVESKGRPSASFGLSDAELQKTEARMREKGVL